MKLMNQKLRYNLQSFAEGGEGNDSGSDSNDGYDDQDDGQEDKSKKSGKTFTQEELDAAIERRLKRERAKAEKAKAKEDVDKNKTPEDKAKDKSDAQDAKMSALEAKLLCFEHDVSKDSVSDVVALAKSYIDDDTDFETAIEKVIKKYPQFVKGSTKSENDGDEEETKGKSWGARQNGTSKKSDGVEAAFLAKNPGLKID